MQAVAKTAKPPAKKTDGFAFLPTNANFREGFSGRTGAFVPYDDAWGTQGWERSPSHCLLDSPNDAVRRETGKE